MFDIEKMTIKELLAEAKSRFPDFDYWSLALDVKDSIGDPLIYSVLDGKGVDWAVAYWVLGDSEGFYVHVDRLWRTAAERYGKRQMVLLGKTFNRDAAIQAAADLNMMLQGYDGRAKRNGG